LGNADAVSAFFAKLGWRTDARITQTAEALGLTGESSKKNIRQAELVAQEAGGKYHVYLFALNSVTAEFRKDLARALRDRGANFLCILADDWGSLEVVHFHRYIPPPSPGGAVPQSARSHLRPRALEVNRRDPSRVALRLLRRLSWTSTDEVAQYEKLESAYTVAEWSEENFNNRTLFSDYYLRERLPERDEWKADPVPAFRALGGIYREAGIRFGNHSEAEVRKGLLEPVLNELGYVTEAVAWPGDGSLEIREDYRLYADSGKETPLALMLAYPWDRSLDGKDDHNDKETGEENPGGMVVSLLAKGDAPWVIVTNGKIWRLYAREAHSRATNYYELDAEEILTPGGASPDDLSDAFRYFWVLFRAEAVKPREVTREGKPENLSLLDEILRESQDFARKLGDRLKERVFDEVFLLLAEGFLTSGRGRRAPAEMTKEDFDSAHQATLTFLYRLLFLFYAESRDLLPVREGRGYPDISLKRLKDEIASVAGTAEYQRKDRLGKHYRDDSYALYNRLEKLFRTVDQGDPARDVPRYNGGLFLTEPDSEDDSPEAETARYLDRHKVPDSSLALALDLLARDEDEKSHALGFVDYKSLGVRQLGSIYEGLLEFRLKVAEKKMASMTVKGHEVWVPFTELEERQKERAEREADRRIVRKGEVYLENDRHERKATGSYYTPDHIVAYIVDQTVGPVLKEKFEAIRPKIREAERLHAAFIKEQEEFKRQRLKPKPDSQMDAVNEAVVRELFDIKVLDPAMGSGHFLVETVDYITDKTIEFLNAFLKNPVSNYLERMKTTILREMDEQQISINPGRLTHVNLLKRHVLKRCIYGVDINPMAVELAKVSLWLDCFTLGAPLSFLDHHLRCGNSLIGSAVEEARTAIEGNTVGDIADLFGTRFAGLMLATDMMRHVGELSDVTSAQVNQSRQEYRKASSHLAPFKRLLDLYTARWFGCGDKALALLRSSEIEKALRAPTEESWRKALGPLSKQFRDTAIQAIDSASSKRFFHWELEFPEVFFSPRSGTHQVIERLAGAGFDAVIGNPPYVRQEGLGEDKEYFAAAHAPVYSGVADLYVYFYHRGLTLCRDGGVFGMITSNKFLRSGYGKALREWLVKHSIHQIVDFRDLPIFSEAIAYPMILIAGQRPPAVDHQIIAWSAPDMDSAGRVAESVSKYGAPVFIKDLRSDGWSLERPKIARLMDKLRNAGSPLDKYVSGKFYYGIKTGYNEAFVIDEAKRKELISADQKSADIIKPFLRGRDIHRWAVEWPGLYLIKTEIGVDMKRYPAIFDHLKNFRKQLETRWDKGDHWYELRACDYYAEFDRPTIRYQVIATYQQFAYSREPFLSNDKTWIIPTDDLSILAVLNSSTAWWFLGRISAHLIGGALELRSIYVGQIPIPEISGEEKRAIENTVATILAAVSSGDSKVVQEQESLLDDRISRLYGLTPDERALISSDPAVINRLPRVIEKDSK